MLCVKEKKKKGKTMTVSSLTLARSCWIKLLFFPSRTDWLDFLSGSCWIEYSLTLSWCSATIRSSNSSSSFWLIDSLENKMKRCLTTANCYYNFYVTFNSFFVRVRSITKGMSRRSGSSSWTKRNFIPFLCVRVRTYGFNWLPSTPLLLLFASFS